MKRLRGSLLLALLVLATVSRLAQALNQEVATAYGLGGSKCTLVLRDKVDWVLRFDDSEENHCSLEVSDREAKRLRQMFADAKKRVKALPPKSDEEVGHIPFRGGGSIMIGIANDKDGQSIFLGAHDGSEKVLFLIPISGRLYEKRYLADFEHLLAITNQ